MVRMERSFRPSPSGVEDEGFVLRVMETARTVSATAISSRLGSKMMFWPTEITRRVIGGRTGWDLVVVLVVSRRERG